MLSLYRGFLTNPLRVYTKLAQGLTSPWLYVPYGTHLDDEEIINKCRRSSKFKSTGVNTLTIFQGNPSRFSMITYDLTEDCSVLTNHIVRCASHTRVG